MKKRVLALVLALALSPTGAFAEEAPANTPAKADDADKLICRVESTTGSRLQKEKRCLTAAQWREMKRDDRMAVEKAQAGRYKNN